MKQTHAGKCLSRLFDISGQERREVAKKCDIAPSYISAIISGRSISGSLLPKLIAAWDNPIHGHELMRAHLIDEIENGNLDPDNFLIEIKGLPPADELTTEQKLQLIEQKMAGNRHLRKKIDFFYALMMGEPDAYEKHMEPQEMAAEDPEPYNPAKGFAEIVDPPKGLTRPRKINLKK